MTGASMQSTPGATQDDDPMSQSSVQTCIRWLALVLDTDIGVATLAEDPACAEAMLLLRSPTVVTGQSLTQALSDGRILDRLLRRVGIPALEAPPEFANAGGGLQAFLRWCRSSDRFPQLSAEDSTICATMRCLQALATWPGADPALPRFELPANRGAAAATFAAMLQHPTPQAASPVVVELTAIVNYYRVTLAACDLLSRSPLSYWPAKDLLAAFTQHRQLLEEYSQVRLELLESENLSDEDRNQALESSLSRHSSRLCYLHASQMSQWQLDSGPTVRQLLQEEPRRARQVRLALSRLAPEDNFWSQKDIESLQLMPAFQVKGLAKSVGRMDDRSNSEALSRARTLVSQMDRRLDLHLDRLQAQQRPSLAALKAIGGSRPDHLKFESLGNLRRVGQLQLMQQHAQRCLGYLWDGALVLVNAESGAFQLMFEATPGSADLLTAHESQANALRIMSGLPLACDSREERQAWLEAARTAREARFPCAAASGGGGHAFRQVFFGPESVCEGCNRCQNSLVGFAYVCSGQCALRLDLACIRTLQAPCCREGDGPPPTPPPIKPKPTSKIVGPASQEPLYVVANVLQTSVGGGTTIQRMSQTDAEKRPLPPLPLAQPSQQPMQPRPLPPQPLQSLQSPEQRPPLPPQPLQSLQSPEQPPPLPPRPRSLTKSARLPDIDGESDYATMEQ